MTAKHSPDQKTGPAIRQMDPDTFFGARDTELARDGEAASELGLPFCTPGYARAWAAAWGGILCAP